MTEQDITPQTEEREPEIEDLELSEEQSGLVTGGVSLHKSGDPEDGGN